MERMVLCTACVLLSFLCAVSNIPNMWDIFDLGAGIMIACAILLAVTAHD